MSMQSTVKRLLAGLLFPALAAPVTASAQEVIYVRAPATIGGEAVRDAQRLTPGSRIQTGPGGVVVVELREWPATENGPCTLFVIASGGGAAIVPRIETAQPRACGRAPGDTLDRALAGTPISTSVLLFPSGKGDQQPPPGYTRDSVIHDRLNAIERGRRGAAAAYAGRGERGRAGRGVTEVVNGLIIETASYGANCGAPAGNMTSRLAEACNGRARCDYVIDYLVIGDPVPGCAKDYRVVYKCTAGGLSSFVSVDPEAGFKKVLRIACQQ